MRLEPDTLSEPLIWFEYPIRVQPHHTDYGGVVWHGTYITWMESARVESLIAADTSLNRLVELGYDLPVVALEIRYRQPLRLGMQATVKTRLEPLNGIRLNWLYEIASNDPLPQLYLTAKVTLVTVNTAHRQVVRQMPSEVSEIIHQVVRSFNPKVSRISE